MSFEWYLTLILLAVLLLLTLIVISLTEARTVAAATPEFTLAETGMVDTGLPPVLVINLERKPERWDWMRSQLDRLDVQYERFIGTDGWVVSEEELVAAGVGRTLIERRGLAGCAASHLRAWQEIADRNDGRWYLIMEDDAHFHPDFATLFPQYWSQVPVDAKIVFPGWCAPEHIEATNSRILSASAMCLQGYMLNSTGAAELLNALTPVEEPIDIVLQRYLDRSRGSYLFNGAVTVAGIRPNDYKESNGRRCMFSGIIYQNHAEQGSTIHRPETVFE